MGQSKDKIHTLIEVREEARLILKQAKDTVVIDNNSLEKKLLPCLREFQADNSSKPSTLSKEGMMLDKELGLNLFYNVVNFCFKDPFTKREYQYIDSSGKIIKRSTGLYMAMANSSIDWNSIAQVYLLTPPKWKEITMLSKENTLYLGSQRRDRLCSFAKYLLKSGFTSVREYLEDLNYDSEKLIENLSASGSFEDEFLKRAQLTAMMLDSARNRHLGKGLTGIEKLTTMADYRIPQLLYNMGAVKISDGLKEKLIKEVPIQSDSLEERSLRASVIEVGRKLSGMMGISESEVDNLLWELSQKMAKENKLPIPHMLVATDKY